MQPPQVYIYGVDLADEQVSKGWGSKLSYRNIYPNRELEAHDYQRVVKYSLIESGASKHNPDWIGKSSCKTDLKGKEGTG